MPGIRITHPVETTCVFTLVAGDRPYRTPYECGQCHRTHTHKTYHINLDGEGAAIVSPEIWDFLQKIPGQPFSLSNEVKKPPPQILRMGFTTGSIHIVGQTGKEIRSG